MAILLIMALFLPVQKLAVGGNQGEAVAVGATVAARVEPVGLVELEEAVAAVPSSARSSGVFALCTMLCERAALCIL